MALAPMEVHLASGSTIGLVATISDEAGVPIADEVTWSSSNDAVATVDALGNVLGVGAGAAQISAAIDSMTASSSVTVAPAARVNLFVASQVLAPGSEAGFAAEVLDAANRKLVASLTWITTDPAIATVTPDGRVQAGTLGTATVRAATPGASGAMTVAVQEPLRGQIAFVSEREAPYGDVQLRPDGGIYLMSADGSNVVKRFAYARLGCNPDRPGSAPYCPFPVSTPVFDAQGLRIAFVSQIYREIEFPVVNVIELCASGGALCQRLDFPGQSRPPGPNIVLSGVAPRFAPDGRRLVFVYDPSTLAVWDLASGTFNKLEVGAQVDEPAWSPDGQRIAYVAGASGDRAIWLMNPDGSGRMRLSAAGSNDRHPAWSPDGMRIAFSRIVGGNADVYAMNSDGSGIANLTDNPAQDRNPAWSPDGKLVAFDSDRDGNREIYVMGVDGSNPVNLTRNPAPDFSPSWSP
jgi:WD40 repeat protein